MIVQRTTVFSAVLTWLTAICGRKNGRNAVVLDENHCIFEFFLDSFLIAFLYFY
jgi:hypothetical protein